MLVQRHCFVNTESVTFKANWASILLQDVSRQIADCQFEGFLIDLDDQRMGAEAEVIADRIHCHRNRALPGAGKNSPRRIFWKLAASCHCDAQDVFAQGDNP